MANIAVTQAPAAHDRSKRGSRRRYLIWLFAAILVLAVVFVGLPGYVGWQMTHPSRDYATRTPAAAGLSYVDVSFPSRIGDVRLSGWFMPSRHSARTVIIAHGYPHHRLNEVPSVPMAQVLVHHGFNVLAFDFRGCGKSGGDTVTLGQDEPGDMLGAVDYLKGRFAGQQVRIGLLGFSLGATTSLETGSQDTRDIRAIVSDSAFADLYPYIVDHADTWTHLPPFPFNRLIAWITPPLTGLDPHKVNAITAVQHLPKTPIFFIAGTADKTISDDNSLDLYRAATTTSKQIWLVPGGGHTTSYEQQPRVYEQRVLAFFQQYLRA